MGRTGSPQIYDANGKCVCITSWMMKNSRQDAAFIVTACNSYDQLTARNKELVGALNGLLKWSDTMRAAYEHPFLNDTAVSNARTLLSQPNA